MHDPRLNGQRIVVTGGNAGIGKESAVALAELGAHVVLTSRDALRGAAAGDEVRARSGSAEVEVMPLDLASFASIRAFVADVAARHDRLDVLLCNAGLVMSRRTETVEGFETTFGVNHLGHFLLTDLLLEHLRASAPARVVVVASHAHKMARHGLDFEDLQSTRHYRGFDAYAKSKLANVYFTRELARRLDGTGVTVNALHPGYVESRFGRDGDVSYESIIRLGARLFAISPEAGAQTSVYLASAPEVASATGGYYAKCAPGPVSRAARDEVAARRLWEASTALVAGAPG